ncbi:RtcB family protein [uncultured Desulfobacter sp.]|uniref:RtcB family protein n=1 Tax=uncultured Desulfobacter sp. TaxID=240139 RepID=UPI002AAC083C|nr:RtcB family protein [uncultured Desulfobacter sp.]
MEWAKKENNCKVPIKSWCKDLEGPALDQAEDLARHPVVFHHVALMPDCHMGYGMPIGGVIAAKDAVIPNAVGVDIGCGMGSVGTNIPVSEASREKIRDIVERVKETVPCGEGNAHKIPQEWDGLDDIDAYEDRGWYSAHVRALALKNLGTLGGGNHFIEIQAGDDDLVWLMIHSGSRHLGNVIARYYNDIAMVLNRTWCIDTPGKDLAFLPTDTPEGQNYIKDMNFALSYARVNRKRIMDRFREAFSHVFAETRFSDEINIHHNYACLENHFNTNVWVHRKGATSARKGEIGIIPGSMGTPSYLVEGLGNPESFMSCSHGAGRVMGRMQATRSLTPEACDKAMQGIVYDRWSKVRKGKTKGMYDLGEAPQAYKNIEDVIKSELDLIRPIKKFYPLGVVKG